MQSALISAARAVGAILLVANAAPSLAAPDAPQKRYADDCSASVRDEPTLSPKVFPNATFAMVEDEIGTEHGAPLFLRHGQEQVRISDKIDLKITLGACETYANIYEFRLGEPVTSRTDQAFWLTRAAQLIGNIEGANQDKVVSLKRLKTALRGRARLSGSAPFPPEGVEGELSNVGFGTTYGVALRREGDATYLTVSYWIGPL